MSALKREYLANRGRATLGAAPNGAAPSGAAPSGAAPQPPLSSTAPPSIFRGPGRKSGGGSSPKPVPGAAIRLASTTKPTASPALSAPARRLRTEPLPSTAAGQPHLAPSSPSKQQLAAAGAASSSTSAAAPSRAMPLEVGVHTVEGVSPYKSVNQDRWTAVRADGLELYGVFDGEQGFLTARHTLAPHSPLTSVHTPTAKRRPRDARPPRLGLRVGEARRGAPLADQSRCGRRHPGRGRSFPTRGAPPHGARARGFVHRL